jgi:hypothetical protein
MSPSAERFLQANWCVITGKQQQIRANYTLLVLAMNNNF